jgi:hypothetical protein
MIEAK